MTVLVKVCAVALAAAVFGVFLRAQQSALSVPLQLAAVVVVLGVLLLTVGKRFSDFLNVLSETALPTALIQTLCKGVAVCLTSEFCASLCRESGSAAAADAVSFAGRLLTVVLALPLCERVMDTVLGLIG